VDCIKPCPRRLGTSATLGRHAPDQPVRVCCQAESRLGLHLPVQRRLTGYGVKPVPIVEPLYAYDWLYAAVEPTTGEAFWWEVPRLDADCCSICRQQCGPPYAESLHIVLRDQAPAHVAPRVPVPENVVLVSLPASSPALNPVERLWEDLKYRIDVGDTRVRSSLTALQDHVAGMVRDYSAETMASLTGYAYLVEAIHALQF
jgi:putative transposase